MKSHKIREAELLSRLKVIDKRLHGIEAKLETEHTADWDDQAIEREEDEVLEGMGRSGVAEMERIRAALGRIADGSYGVCVTCGSDISEERLDLVPDTPFCRNCAP